MRRTRRVKVLGWRWRRNSLRRHSDVVEAWIVLATWACATAGAAAAGMVGAQAVDASLARDRAERRPVTAVLLRITPSGSRDVATGLTYDPVKATVRWTDARGTVRTATAEVKAATAVGNAVTVWTDGHGHLVGAPVPRAEATARVTLAGAGIALTGGSVVLVGGRLVRLRVERRATDRWGDEWARTGERWGRRTG